MIDPAGLVAVARRLTAGDGAPPSAEAIRRAVSTAYYPLFHAVLKEGADRFVGPGGTSAAYGCIYRGFDHGQVGRVLEAVDRSTLTDPYRRRLGRVAVSPEMRRFASIFVPLQELRQLADYDPTISQSDADGLIDDVEDALQALRTAAADEKADLLALMLFKAR